MADYANVMTWPAIKKPPETWRVRPNLVDYEKLRASLSWDHVREELAGPVGATDLNIAHVAVDRHAEGPRRDHLGLRWLGKDGRVLDYSYAELRCRVIASRMSWGNWVSIWTPWTF